MRKRKKKRQEMYEMDESFDMDDEEEEGGRSKRKIFIIVLIMIGLTVAVIAFLFITRDKNLVVDAYVSGEESVDSLTTLVGERKMKEEVSYEVDGITKTEYIYERDGNTKSDLKEYKTYLLNDCGFTQLDTEEEEDPPEVIYESFVIEAQEEGYIFELEITLQEEEFSIAVSTKEGEVPKPEKESREFTRTDAKPYFEEFLRKKGNLPNPVESYNIMFDVGQTTINDEICYGITVYEAGEGGYNKFVQKYYMSLKDRNIYLYDNVTRTSTLVEQTQPSNTIEKMDAKEGSVTVGSETDMEDEDEDVKEKRGKEEKEDSKKKENKKDKEDKKDKKDKKNKDNEKDTKDQVDEG